MTARIVFNANFDTSKLNGAKITPSTVQDWETKLGYIGGFNMAIDTFAVSNGSFALCIGPQVISGRVEHCIIGISSR